LQTVPRQPTQSIYSQQQNNQLQEGRITITTLRLNKASPKVAIFIISNTAAIPNGKILPKGIALD
jgi:hypothetical protein